jgi:acyl-CoA reductase-like NAD-dependent aldehyde dehydrogenase
MIAAQHMKKGCYELGGNDAFVVLKDANLEAAVEAAYTSRMMCAGQMCNAAKRFILEAPIYDKFKDMLIAKIKSSTVIGDPMNPNVNLGPMAGEAHLEKIKNQVERAVNEGGADHIYGDYDIRTTRPELADGNYTDVLVF